MLIGVLALFNSSWSPLFVFLVQVHAFEVLLNLPASIEARYDGLGVSNSIPEA